MRSWSKAAWPLLLAAGSCNAIFGVDDPVVREPELDASAGSAGSGVGGSSGLGGTSGLGGSGGSSAAGGTAGSDAGSGGVSGTAGQDAGGDAPVEASCSENLSIDPVNCGACGHDCLGAACENGLCVPEKLGNIQRGADSLQVVPGGLVYVHTPSARYARFDLAAKQESGWPVGGYNMLVQLFGSDAYFINRYLGDIYKAPIDGSAGPVLHLDLASSVRAFAIDASGLYYFDCQSWLTASVFHAAIDGSGASQLATGVICPEYVRADADALYLHGGYKGDVQRVGKPGKPDAGKLTTLAVDGNGYGLALDDQHVYYTRFDAAGEVRRVKKDGTGPQLIAGNQSLPTGVLIVGDHVYWLNAGNFPELKDGSVQRAKIETTGFGPVETIAQQQAAPFALAADATHVYWTNSGPAAPSAELGALFRVAR